MCCETSLSLCQNAWTSVGCVLTLCGKVLTPTSPHAAGGATVGTSDAYSSTQHFRQGYRWSNVVRRESARPARGRPTGAVASTLSIIAFQSARKTIERSMRPFVRQQKSAGFALERFHGCCPTHTTGTDGCDLSTSLRGLVLLDCCMKDSS